MAQKVITVNINLHEGNNIDPDMRNYAHDLEGVNRYLDEGWKIIQTIHTPQIPGNTVWFNITFLLEKDSGS